MGSIEVVYKLGNLCSPVVSLVRYVESFAVRKTTGASSVGDKIALPATTSHADTSVQQRLLSEIFTLVSARPASACNFLPLPPLLAPPTSSTTSPAEQQNDLPSLVTYRHYATLYFILISTSTESPLALLDLIQVFVEALDRLFENVCELDLIFNFETLHAVA
ncbi:hypothetical protein CAC42_4116 [Sphaceloma murrayae]|uniref:AP complex mu/sigma subunit domain-containing protein n=1 Tax=Sphaceloma murrayae TaxID=2082308 RepID=A0A2K1QKH8_9PEZI|nr:hypothetical protein CAC42_4116 [Sphaceloma murrayae]